MTDIANKCKGIIIEVGGDTKPLVKELSEANKTSRSLQSELRDVEKLLKLDLWNIELVIKVILIMYTAYEIL